MASVPPFTPSNRPRSFFQYAFYYSFSIMHLHNAILHNASSFHNAFIIIYYASSKMPGVENFVSMPQVTNLLVKTASNISISEQISLPETIAKARIKEVT